MKTERNLRDAWYDTPDIHFCTLTGLIDLCARVKVKVERKIAVNAQDRRANLCPNVTFVNLFAEQAVFLLRR